MILLKFVTTSLLLATISAIASAQHLINCPTGRYSNCYNLPETGKCCFGHAEEPEVHVNDVALLLYDSGLQQFSANTRVEHCVFLIVHDYVSQASSNWITNLAHSIQNIGKCIVQSKVHAQSGKSQQADAMRREHVLYNPAMPYRKVDPTIIIVDWAGPAMTLYQTAAGAAVVVGRILAEKLSMHRQFVMKRPNIHCIGEGLGAHICGVAGSNYALGEFMRISGLDPSRPLFEPSDDGYDVPFDDRLDPSDAKFVDVIHTTSDLGFVSTMGHIDFYVNGKNGKANVTDIQSQCSEAFDGDRSHMCSHKRAREIFQSSFQRQCFFRTCGSNGTNENDRCYAGWSSYRCKGQGDYCGYVTMDSAGFAQCYYDQTLMVVSNSNKRPDAATSARKAPLPNLHPVIPMFPTMPAPEQLSTSKKTSSSPQTTQSLPPHLFRVAAQSLTQTSSTKHAVTKEQTTSPPIVKTTTTQQSSTATAAAVEVRTTSSAQQLVSSTQSTAAAAVDPSTRPPDYRLLKTFDTKPFYAASLFTDVGGNCAGNTMITLHALTVEQCAKSCLDTLGCAGYSIERLHPGPQYTCMIKSLGCQRPNPEGDFKFFRRDM